MTNAARFAIKESKPVDSKSPYYWNFTAWSTYHPDRLLTAEQAERELARLHTSLAYKADRLAIVDVLREQARGKAVGGAVRSFAAAMGYDAVPEGAEKEALRVEIRAVRLAAMEAFEAVAA